MGWFIGALTGRRGSRRSGRLELAALELGNALLHSAALASLPIVQGVDDRL